MTQYKTTEAQRAAAKRWQAKNKERIKEYRKENRTERIEAMYRWQRNNPARKLWHQAKTRARQKGWEFSLTPDDFVIPTHCPYLGLELTFIQKQGHVNSNFSLDRIDSSKGYVKGNVQVISALANRMKQDATPEQLLAFAQGVLRLHGQLE